MGKTTYRLELLETVFSLFSHNIPLFASETDNRFEATARQSYVFKTYLKSDDIQVLYNNGMVTLTGTVSDTSHKSLARETIAHLPGVAGVQSRLKENGAVPAVDTDEWLIAKVKSTLLFHQNLNAGETEVVAKNGTVILRGRATSTAQKNLTTEYVKDLEGVKKVKNEMTVLATDTLSAGENKMAQTRDAGDESIDDASVTALVKTTLLYHRSTTGLDITVETKDGVVKLEGNARNWAEKNLITKLVIDVPGVKMVFNNMTVDRRVSMDN
jgi:osmotically-inducible protein OsmY